MNRNIHTFTLLLSAILLLSACLHKENPDINQTRQPGDSETTQSQMSNHEQTQLKEDPSVTESLHWSSWPKLNFGTLEYEKLTADLWYSGRTEATSQNVLAETKAGYYFSKDQILWYAEKSDLSVWVPVCNKPNCAHSATSGCNALNMGGKLIIKDGRYYSTELISDFPDLFVATDTNGFAIYSRNLDGTDIRLEYGNEKLLPNGGGSINMEFTAEHWIVYLSILNTDGSYTYQCFRTTANGTELLAEDVVADSSVREFTRLRTAYLSGEPSFDHLFLGTPPYSECRYVDGIPTFTDLEDYYDTGRYWAGNIIRLFRSNDGYYDVNLDTKEEVKIADAQLANSDAMIELPNCIVESTLFHKSHKQLPEGTNHTMTFFDGQQWRTVALPVELLEPQKDKYLNLACVTSDSVFFQYAENRKIHLYRIPIGDGELHMEYCGRIK